MNIANDDLLPKPPTFSDELIEQCKQSRDFRPILFEWYKFVGVLCNTVSCISPDSPAFRKISPVHYAVLILQRKVEKGKQKNFVHLPGRAAVEGQIWTISGVDLVQMPLIRTQLLLSAANQHLVLFHWLHKVRLA